MPKNAGVYDESSLTSELAVAAVAMTAILATLAAGIVVLRRADTAFCWAREATQTAELSPSSGLIYSASP